MADRVPCPAVANPDLDAFVLESVGELPGTWACVFCGVALSVTFPDAVHGDYPAEVDTAWRLDGEAGVKALLASLPGAFPAIEARVERGWS